MSSSEHAVSETITLEGHIIDSHALSRVLDDIHAFGGQFRILEVHIGRTRDERSLARIEVSAETPDKLRKLLHAVGKRGALWHEREEVELVAADMDGALPEEFYSTTNQHTQVYHNERWYDVQRQEMDCALVYDAGQDVFFCQPMTLVRKGDQIVCGQRGVKLLPFERQAASGVFEFMRSEISTEKPKTAIIRNIAEQLVEARDAGRKILLVGGPAIVHTGAVPHIEWLIENGFIHLLFAGNALAVHDIEYSLLGTSLGVYLDKATLADAGHENHLRAINTIRRAGGIAQAVEAGILTSGIMHACVRHNVKYVLSGSVRDDGPLPDVESDMVIAQQKMRELVPEIGFALMVATALLSIATGNLLPAWIPAVAVDISPSVLTKLSDRGSFQTIGLVTDVEPFFHELVSAIQVAAAGAAE